MRDPLLENYLAFLASFRGVRREEPHAVAIDSDRADFRLRIPCASAPPDLADDPAATLLVDAHLTTLDARLAASGRRRQADLVFMVKEAGDDGDGSEAIGVRVARTAEDIDAFTRVQARGFLEDPRECEAWRPWLGVANQRNLANDRCCFLMADCEDAPAAVALLVESEGVRGIYAVATLPAYRRRGLSSRLLAAGEAIARRRGAARVALQVYAETYAHGFYARRGFREQLRYAVWTPPETDAGERTEA